VSRGAQARAARAARARSGRRRAPRRRRRRAARLPQAIPRAGARARARRGQSSTQALRSASRKCRTSGLQVSSTRKVPGAILKKGMASLGEAKLVLATRSTNLERCCQRHELSSDDEGGDMKSAGRWWLLRALLLALLAAAAVAEEPELNWCVWCVCTRARSRSSYIPSPTEGSRLQPRLRRAASVPDGERGACGQLRRAV